MVACLFRRITAPVAPPIRSEQRYSLFGEKGGQGAVGNLGESRFLGVVGAVDRLHLDLVQRGDVGHGDRVIAPAGQRLQRDVTHRGTAAGVSGRPDRAHQSSLIFLEPV